MGGSGGGGFVIDLGTLAIVTLVAVVMMALVRMFVRR